MSQTDREASQIVVPVVAEALQVEKRVVETGRLRIHKTVHETEEIIDEPLLREEVFIEHRPINLLCEGPAPVARHEGDTLIIPVLEEVLVVEKRLLLKEELHIHRQQKTVHAPQSITLRREEVTVERSESVATEPGSTEPSTEVTSK